jgi:hypothetical protein
MPDMNSSCPINKINNIADNIIDYLRINVNKRSFNERNQKAFHAKTIGILQGKLVVKNKLSNQFVNKELTKNLAQGLFSESYKNKEYDITVRFSNGAQTIKHDKGKAVYGMAIKIKLPEDIKNLKGENFQDIILFTSPIHGINNLAAQVAVPRLLYETPKGFALAIQKSPSLLFRFKDFFTFWKNSIKFLFISRKQCSNVLEEMYFSATPYAFGNINDEENIQHYEAIKWHVRPLKIIESLMPNNPSKDFLTAQLQKDLDELGKEFKDFFELRIQFNESSNEPIEETAIEWKSKFYTVGIIKFNKQNVITENNLLNHCPGNAIEAHRPLGYVNKIRMKVYDAMALLRKTNEKSV